MKKVGKDVKILTTLVLLVLAFLSVFNITYSYFTATANIDGNLNFARLDVRFTYEIGNTETVLDNTSAVPLQVVPILENNKTTLSRGETFTFGIDGGNDTVNEIDSLYVKHNPEDANMEDFADCYVRFWVDAFEIINTNGNITYGKTNFGKYFLFDDGQGDNYITNKNNSKANSWCYFSKFALTAGDVSSTKVDSVYLGNTLTIDPNAPVDMLQKALKITISFEAIQTANSAHTSGFNDDRGYYKNWK